MKKQIIEFNERKYNEKIKEINKVIEVVNKNIPILVTNGITPTIETLKKVTTNHKEFRKNKYIEELTKLSDSLGLPLEYIIDNSLSSTEWIYMQAKGKISYLHNIETLTYLYNWCFDNKYFDIVEGKAVLKSDYLDKVREVCTIYTDTTNQNETLLVVQEIAKQFSKLANINGIDIPYYLYLYNGEYKINGSLFKQIF